MITNNNAKEEKNKNQKIYDSCEYMPRSVNNKSVSLLDRELGTLRGNFFKVKILFINIYNYLKSFFTRRKLDQVKSVFFI